MYDIAIIGLGPAGSTIARMLSEKFSIIAIDKKSTADSNGFQKPCGGLLASDAQKALSKFNLTLPKQVLADPQIFAVKTIDTKQNLLRFYQRHYVNLDRHKFDLWLKSLIPKGVEIIDNGVCTNIRKVADIYEITYVANQVEHIIKAKRVVGADGSNSIVRKLLFPNKKIQQYISIQQWFSELHPTPFYSCIFDSDITDSYCWSISKDGFFILGGAFPRKHGKEKFELLKKKLSKCGYSFDQPIKTEACLVSMPKKISDFCAGKDNAFLVGEAGGYISPSSLEGISYALNSAYELATILNTCEKKPASKYSIKSLPTSIKLMLKFLKTPFMYNPFLRKCIMKSGISSIKVMGVDSLPPKDKHP